MKIKSYLHSRWVKPKRKTLTTDFWYGLLAAALMWGTFIAYVSMTSK
jgi:hypothetical protein